MGFIRIQTKIVKGKKYCYYYYSQRLRSKKKDGGNGKVKSNDKLIGKELGGQEYSYLYFWIWKGLSVKDYIQAYVCYEIKKYSLLTSKDIKIQFSTNKLRVTEVNLVFYNNSGDEVLKKDLQKTINEIVRNQDKVKKMYDEILAIPNDYVEALSEKNEYDSSTLYCYFKKIYNEKINNLLKYCPPSKRKLIKKKIENNIRGCLRSLE